MPSKELAEKLKQIIDDLRSGDPASEVQAARDIDRFMWDHKDAILAALEAYDERKRLADFIQQEIVLCDNNGVTGLERLTAVGMRAAYRAILNIMGYPEPKE